MTGNETREVLKNIDHRLQHVEQVLPTLATKDELKALATRDELKALATKEELQAAVAQLATKGDLAAAVAPLATKDELNAAVALLATKEELKAALAPLATRQELKQEIREEGERSRRYMQILNEDIKDTVKLYAEQLVGLNERDARQHADTLKAHAALERRVTALEAKRSKRRG